MAFNIHGQSSEPVDIVLSDGTVGSAPSSADVNRLRESLLVRGVSAGSCNWQGDTGLSLCGTINTEGGLYNNSPDPCGTVSTIPSGLFFHLEQKRNIRDNPSLLIEAMKEVFPLSLPAPPPAPVDLVATAGNAWVILSWTAASAATGYNVYRSLTAEAPGSKISSGAASTTYTDLSLVNGTTYFYFVTAVNAGGEGAASNKVTATPTVPPPPAPGGLTASGLKRRIVLGWKGSTGAASYKVKRGTTSGGPYTTITEGALATSYTDSSVERGLIYYYVVTAVNGSGESANSNQASAAPR
jgi:hypothetical protein